MNTQLSKILSIITGIISLVAIFFLVRIIMEGDDVVKESLEVQNSIVSPYITFAKVVLIITAVLAVGFSLLNLIKHPKALKKALISVGVLAVLLAIAYAMADDGATLSSSGNVLKDGEAGSTSKWVSTGITYSLILGTVALIGVLWDFVKSLVSK